MRRRNLSLVALLLVFAFTLVFCGNNSTIVQQGPIIWTENTQEDYENIWKKVDEYTANKRKRSPEISDDPLWLKEIKLKYLYEIVKSHPNIVIESEKSFSVLLTPKYIGMIEDAPANSVKEMNAKKIELE